MIGNWLRVTPAELAKAREDLGWAYQLVQAAQDSESSRLYHLDKTWHAFDFLLERHGFSVPIVLGAESFVDTPDDELAEDDEDDEDDDTDWGYGPPTYLTPEQVATAATELATLTEEALTRGVDPAELTRAEIYPNVWDRPGELDWAVHHLSYVRRFFAAAARSGDGIICWID
ncbi:YfbM family protein [Micromonospora sp. NPDC050397]|uniref:YfbM family protein n=1 Tax=Micromonospora sp. NPDC050397 TaxID=3364279 RepID=UPI0038512B6C